LTQDSIITVVSANDFIPRLSLISIREVLHIIRQINGHVDPVVSDSLSISNIDNHSSESSDFIKRKKYYNDSCLFSGDVIRLHPAGKIMYVKKEGDKRVVYAVENERFKQINFNGGMLIDHLPKFYVDLVESV
jgi:hypothetical protein